MGKLPKMSQRTAAISSRSVISGDDFKNSIASLQGKTGSPKEISMFNASKRTLSKGSRGVSSGQESSVESTSRVPVVTLKAITKKKQAPLAMHAAASQALPAVQLTGGRGPLQQPPSSKKVEIPLRTAERKKAA